MATPRQKKITAVVAIGGVTVATITAMVTDVCNVFPDEPGGETDTMDSVDGSGGESSSTGASTTEPTTEDTGTTDVETSSTSSTTEDTTSDTSTGAAEDTIAVEDTGDAGGDDGSDGRDVTTAFCVNTDYPRSWTGASLAMTNAALRGQLHYPGVAVDADYYPTQDQHSQYLMILWNSNDGLAAHTGTYRVLWDGPGAVNVDRATRLESIAGGYRIAVTGETRLSVTGRISNLRVLRDDVWICPDDVITEYLTHDAASSTCGSSATNLADAYEANPARWRYRPAYMARLRKYGAIRAMMEVIANESTITSFAQHTRPTAVTHSIVGVPYEHLFDLASTVGVDAWITIPWRIEDAADYARHVAQIARQHLRGQVLWIEWSNEEWNGAFAANQNADAVLRLRYPGLAGVGDNVGAVNLDAAAQLTPRETIKACTAAREILGPDEMECVLAGWVGGVQPGVVPPSNFSFGPGTYNGRMLAHIVNPTLNLDPDHVITTFATAPYYTGATVTGTSDYLAMHRSYQPTGIERVAATVRGVRAANAVRLAAGHPPLKTALYEWGDHFTASGSVLATMRQLTHEWGSASQAEVSALYRDYLATWWALTLPHERGPACLFSALMNTDGNWSFEPLSQSCESSAKCRAAISATPLPTP